MSGTKKCNKKVRECHYKFCPEDTPTQFNNLEYRIVYTVVVWFLMMYKPSEDAGIFTAIMLFYIPLFIDYLKFNNQEKVRKIVRKIGIGTCLVWLAIGFLGLTGVLVPKVIIANATKIYTFELSKKCIIGTGASINFTTVWVLMGFSVFLTFVDKFVFSNAKEKEIINSVHQSFNT